MLKGVTGAPMQVEFKTALRAHTNLSSYILGTYGPEFPAAGPKPPNFLYHECEVKRLGKALPMPRYAQSINRSFNVAR